MTEREELTFEDLMLRVGELVDHLESELDERHRDQMFELLDHLEAFHREGITRMAMAMPPDALDQVHEDPLVSHLLEAYLGEEEASEDPELVVEEALNEIRPYVHSHGGEMELVAVQEGIVTLRLMGACDGCPASSATLTQGVESTLREKWPGFRRLRVESDVDHDHGHDHGQGGEQLLQIQSLKRD
ncbi:MAG: NifU family protein [Actinobacteria bacterium]|nr:NifU family protein [Actinomycetota bacterium]